MKKYVVTATVARFGAGALLKLTPAQAAPRKHCLEFEGANVYKVIAPVEFKRGEELGAEGEFSKTMLQELAVKGKAAVDTDSTQKDEKRTEKNTKIKAAPSIIKLADENGVDLSEVVGTGKNGALTKKDVEDYIASKSDEDEDDQGGGGDDKKAGGLPQE